MSSNTPARKRASGAGFVVSIAIAWLPGHAASASPNPGPTVRDVVEFTRIVQPLHHDRDALQAQRSPDGKHAFIVTRRSDVATDRNRFELLLLDLDVRRVRERRAAAPVVIHALESRKDADDSEAAIQDARWVDDRTIAFRGRAADRAPQAFRVDVTTRRVGQLTFERLGVVRFDVSSDLRHVLYVAPVPNPALPEGTRSVVVGTHSFWSVNFPQAGLRTQQRFYRYMAASAGSHAAPRQLGAPFAESSSGIPAASLSPDGRWALVPRYEAGRQAEWANHYTGVADATTKYGPSTKVDPLGFFSRPFSYVPRRMIAYRVADGREQPVVDAPDDSLPGNQSRLDRLWMRGGASVVIAGTYLPVAAGDPVPDRSHIVEYWPDTGRWKVIADLGQRLKAALRVDGDAEAFIALDGDLRRRFELGVDGEWREATNHDARGERAVVSLNVEESLDQPPNIVGSLPSGESLRLTNLNPQFATSSWGTMRPYRWKDAADRTWLGGLMTPTGFVPGSRYPLVIQPYGFSPTRFYLDGANTYTGFTSGFAGRAFLREGILVLALPWTAVGAEEERERDNIVSFTEGVRAAIAALVADGVVDPNRIGIMGWSATGERVLNLITFTDVPIRAASLLDGDANTLFSMTITYAVMDGIQRRKEEASDGAPYGASLERWVRNDPSLHTDCIRAALRIESYGPETHNNWDIYALLRRQYKPAEMIVLPGGSHALARPSERMISLQGNVDWYRFWLSGEERIDPAVPGETVESLKKQYVRWRQLADIKRAADVKPGCVRAAWPGNSDR